MKTISLGATFCISALVGWSVVDPLGQTVSGTVVSADDPECSDKVRAYDDHALVYLGNEFEGLPLLTCQAPYFPATDYGIPETRFFAFVYGCLPLADEEREGCTADVQVTVFPCDGPDLADEVTERANLNIRGAGASRKHDGSIYIKGATVNVMISTGRHTEDAKNQAERAAHALIGANALSAAFDESDSFSDVEKIKPGANDVCS
ncbi:MAG: hypothetical protein WEB52_12355 [Dehalococcoidia bacterium]